MLIYAAKRMLYMIPTVFGVLLLMFLLFNVVGGSPAAVVLGKNATAKSLDEYDEQHGFNKPLIVGRWVRTRAYADTARDASVGAWPAHAPIRPVADEAGGSHVAVTGPARIEWPLAFTLQPGAVYRWTIVYRSPGGATAVLSGGDEGAEGGVQALPATENWRRVHLRFRAGSDPSSSNGRLEVGPGLIEIRSLQLRRRMSNPFDSQFVFYVRQLLHGDFGVSLETNQKVTDILRQGAGPSLCLAIPILLGNLLVSIVLALVCAYFRDRVLDRLLVILATALMSVNYVVWVIAGQYVLAFRLGWFPIWGYESWAYLVLPVLIGIVTSAGRDVRFYRTFMLDEMYKDYVRTAIAKGVSRPRMLFRHVLPNALVPVVTNISMVLPFLFTGSLLLENYFGIPGLGGVSINAIHSGDMDVVRAVVLIGALAYVVVNLVTDLLYAWVDPRVRLN